MKLQNGSVIRSVAGHDLGDVFVVVDFSDKFVLICNGKQRPLEKPKRKNLIHIAITNTTLTSEQIQTNKGLRKALSDCKSNSAKTSLKGGF